MFQLQQAIHWILIGLSLSTNGNLLECSVDKEQLQNIINDIKSKGYTVERQSLLSTGGQSSNLAPNSGGAYASVLRNNVSYNSGDTFIDVPLSFTYKMGAKTAVLFHGCTAPQSQYFGYKTYLWKTDENIWIWGALGDIINNNVIKTYHKFNQYNAAPFDDLTTIISTADNQTYSDILNVYAQHGITRDMINLDDIPSDIITMGTNQDTALHTLYRVNLPSNVDSFNEYFANINNPDSFNVYFITKGNEEEQYLPQQPIPTQSMKDRVCRDPRYKENGNEYYLEDKYNELRDKLIETMRDEFNYKNKKCDAIMGTEYDGFKCIEDNSLCAGNSPDCLYYEDYNGDSFLIKAPDGVNNMLNMNIKGYYLKENNLYIIMGVNHYNLGLSTFNQETIYDEQYNVIDVDGTTMNNFEYNASANYFNDESNDYSEFYMIMYARPGHCIQEMVHKGIKCVEIDYEALDKKTGFVVFSRVYLNPCTNTGPSKQQFLYEYLMEFKSKNSGANAAESHGYVDHNNYYKEYENRKNVVHNENYYGDYVYYKTIAYLAVALLVAVLAVIALLFCIHKQSQSNAFAKRSGG